MSNIKSITHRGTVYEYEQRLAKNGEECLATEDPNEYCNGTFSYSSKDPGSGLEFVVTKSTPKLSLNLKLEIQDLLIGHQFTHSTIVGDINYYDIDNNRISFNTELGTVIMYDSEGIEHIQLGLESPLTSSQVAQYLIQYYGK